jgi:hypothetical protein
MIERRFEGRFLCADLVTVEWQTDEGSDVDSRIVEAVLEDISALGACVQVDESIPFGAPISISVSARPVDAGPVRAIPTRFSGHVSYCVFRDYGYFVGVRFSEQTRWSSGLFLPQHLTNLQSLMVTEENGVAIKKN